MTKITVEFIYPWNIFLERYSLFNFFSLFYSKNSVKSIYIFVFDNRTAYVTRLNNYFLNHSFTEFHVETVLIKIKTI